MNMTPTPRSDSMMLKGEFVQADFARQLERELAAERALADRLMGELQWWSDHYKTADDQEAIAAWKHARNPVPSEAEIDAHLNECVAKSALSWKPLPGDEP